MKAIQLVFEIIVIGGIISVLGTCVGPAVILGVLGVGACQMNKEAKMAKPKPASSLITRPFETPPPRAIIIPE